jgi:hypothetical protein
MKNTKRRFLSSKEGQFASNSASKIKTFSTFQATNQTGSFEMQVVIRTAFFKI